MQGAWKIGLLALAVAGCDGKTTPTDTTPTDETDVTTTTGPSGDCDPQFFNCDGVLGAFGELIIGRRAADVESEAPRNYAYGVVFEDDFGWLNLIACSLEGHVCTDSYPAEGESLTPVLAGGYLPDDLSAGDITLANTFLTQDNAFNPPIYVGLPIIADLDAGPGNLSYAGELVPFTGDGVFNKVSAIGATAPATDARVRTNGSDASITFEWAAGGEGDVILEVADTIWHLADNGSFTLNISDTSLTGPVAVSQVTLSRMELTEFTAGLADSPEPPEKINDDGVNTWRIQSRSDQVWWVDHVDAPDRTELADGVQMAGTCGDAGSVAPIGAGLYYGFLSDYDNDITLPANNATLYWPTAGRDGFVKVALSAGQTLDITYLLPLFDAQLYLLDDTCDEDNPLAGVDDETENAETLSYTATEAEVVYVVLDAFVPDQGSVFALDIEITDP